ncbi:MAG TPA: tetratricopeptide repeat protein, partial [Gemmatimonadaceae bacterium]|nr:tetratricopeptide repeat protein [Gemmatimonadaceae bacterium]
MGIFVLTIAGYMGMRLMGIGPAGSLLAAGVLDQRAPVLVAEFQSGGQDTLLGSVVTEAFRTDLGQSRAVTAVQPVFIHEALQRMQFAPNTKLTAEVARELATREGIKLLVDGEISPVGAGYVLSARLVSPASGEILAAFRETASSGDDLISAIDRLSKRTREKIGESIKSVRASPPLEQVTTGSLEALRRYTQALDPATEYDRGLQLLEDAIALDSTFAMAYRRLGTQYANRGDMVRAIPTIEKAYATRDRLPALEKYLTEGSYWGTAMGDRERAISAYEAALEVSPTNLTALNNVALLYAEQRDYARGEAYLQRALQADSNFMNGYINLAFAQLINGKAAEARRTMDRGLERFPNVPVLHATDVALRYASGDTAADQPYRRAFSNPRSTEERIIAAGLGANFALLGGRIAEFHRLRADGATLERSRAGAPALIDLRPLGDSGQVALHVLQDTALAGRLYDRAVRSPLLRSIPASDVPYLDLAYAAARLRRADEARQWLRQWETNTRPDRRGAASDFRHAILGIIALTENQPEAALNQLRTAAAGACETCVLPDLGLAYVAVGPPDSVIAVYERYLTIPHAGRLGQDAWMLAGMLERLGQLYEAKGDRARAIHYYERFAAQWRGADAPLQPRVQAARATLARLRAQSSS